jgi:hypothetical protein
MAPIATTHVDVVHLRLDQDVEVGFFTCTLQVHIIGGRSGHVLRRRTGVVGNVVRSRGQESWTGPVHSAYD